MISKYIEEIFYQTLIEFVDIPIYRDELRQFGQLSYEEDEEFISEVSEERFKEGLFLEVIPLRSSLTNISDSNYTVEIVYRTNLTYKISPDFLKKQEKMKSFELITSHLYIIPFLMTDKTIFKDMYIINNNVNYDKVSSSEYRANMDITVSINVKMFNKDKLFELDKFLFNLKLKMRGENKDG